MKSIAVFSQNKKVALSISEEIKKNNGHLKISVFTEPIEMIYFAVENIVGGIFIDIDSPVCDDLKLIKIISALDDELPMIFVSKSGRYAIEGFRYGILDYLELPLDEERANEAIEKLAEKKKSNNRKKIYIKTFGAFEVSIGGHTIPWKNSKTKELLAFLVDSRGDNVSSEKIQQILWPDADPIKVAAIYHTTLHNLRKKLGNNGIGHILEGFRGSQRVNTAEFACDLYEFEKCMEAGDTSAYSKAFEMYKGRYLENNAYDWSQFTKLRIDMQFEQLCHDL